MNSATSAKLGVKDGEMVLVTSRRGKITCRASVTGKIKENVVFMPFHFAEGAANTLTNPALDPISKIPEYKVCAVNIEKISATVEAPALNITAVDGMAEGLACPPA
jgi:predicted molibdopterin-dependent oxidoreductase YjgC